MLWTEMVRFFKVVLFFNFQKLITLPPCLTKYSPSYKTFAFIFLELRIFIKTTMATKSPEKIESNPNIPNKFGTITFNSNI